MNDTLWGEIMLNLNIKMTTFLLTSTLLTFSCVKEEIASDPVSELNAIVKPLGFIGFQNAMERGDGDTHTGIMVGGTPTSLSYISHYSTCFPQGDALPRYENKANINKKYNYTFQGNLGFLTLGVPIVSAGLGLQDNMNVSVEIHGLTIEYMDSIDVTDWYREGMKDTCREYLESFGFFIQTIHTDSMKLSVKRVGGTDIGLSADNIGNYFKFEAGVHWEIIDEKTVEITSPHTLGYQIALMRPQDNGQVLVRASSVEDNKFVFEEIGFADYMNDEPIQTENKSLVVEGAIDLSQHIVK